MAARLEESGTGGALPLKEETEENDIEFFSKLLHCFNAMTLEQKALLVEAAEKILNRESALKSLEKV